ncbi:hypothetical protein [Gordonia sp. DT101]|uniref:hypothetical protein n=1 Tax=Gordonia sp. DT101 TaxID=3416545 RepID=UPI003CEC6446
MASTYTDAHRNACADALAALGNRIGLYTADGVRVGTVYGDTTWGTASKVTEDGYDWAKKTGSTVALTVPAVTVPNGTVIAKYGVHSGSTLLRTEDLPVSLVVNDGTQSFSVDVTPILRFRGL